MKTKPIKRSDELKTLSHEHHMGLLFCWKIREGLKLNVEPSRLGSYLNYFWENHLKNHFLNEEALLFDRIDEPVCRHAKIDHLTISTYIEKINTTAKHDLNVYLVLAEMLSNHIRYEERIAFPFLEQHLSAATLQGVSLYLQQNHTDDFKDEYSDEFWKKTKIE